MELLAGPTTFVKGHVQVLAFPRTQNEDKKDSFTHPCCMKVKITNGIQCIRKLLLQTHDPQRIERVEKSYTPTIIAFKTIKSVDRKV